MTEKKTDCTKALQYCLDEFIAKIVFDPASANMLVDTAARDGKALFRASAAGAGALRGRSKLPPAAPDTKCKSLEPSPSMFLTLLRGPKIAERKR